MLLEGVEVGELRAPQSLGPTPSTTREAVLWLYEKEARGLRERMGSALPKFHVGFRVQP